MTDEMKERKNVIEEMKVGDGIKGLLKKNIHHICPKTVTYDDVIKLASGVYSEIPEDNTFQKVARKIAKPFDNVPGTKLTDYIGDKIGTSKYSKIKKATENFAKKHDVNYDYGRKEHNGYRHDIGVSAGMEKIENIILKMVTFKEAATDLCTPVDDNKTFSFKPKNTRPTT